MELIESIKEKNGGETNARNWSKEDIDRLLELTDRGKQLEELELNEDENEAEEKVVSEEPPAATEALSEFIFPFIGNDTMKSHFSLTSLLIPLPSDPITRPTPPS